MLVCYVTIKLLRQTCLLISSIVASCSGHICKRLHLDPQCELSLIPRGLYKCCCWLGWHFWHTHQTRENASQTPLHTVSRKHVAQPENRSKTLGTGVNLNVAQLSSQVHGEKKDLERTALSNCRDCGRRNDVIQNAISLDAIIILNILHLYIFMFINNLLITGTYST